MLRILQGVVAVLGRLMLCAIFLMSAVGNKIPNFEQVAGYMAGADVPQPKIMLAGAIVFLIVGSVSIVFGYRARFGASLLLVFLGLATYYFHNFWAFEEGSPEHQQQMIHFLKNLALMGAMVLIIASGAGPCSLDGWKCCRADVEPAD